MKRQPFLLLVIGVLFVLAISVAGLSIMRFVARGNPQGEAERLAFGTPLPEMMSPESSSGPAVPVPTIEVPPVVVEAPNVVSNVYIEYILDGSGSMMGRLPDGTLKRDVAKEVFLAHLESFPPGMHIGLRVFGNNIEWRGHEKESCHDIEVVAPVETGRVEKIVAWLKGFHPRGMTPLAGAIMEAIGDFKSGPGRVNSIIVISDGKETCGGDPCKLVEVMKQKGIHFSLHVVGLNVDKKTEQELQCIAKAGGGLYKEARNAQEVNEALKEIEKKEVHRAERKATPVRLGVSPTAERRPTRVLTLAFTDTPVPTRRPEAVVEAEVVNVRSGPGMVYPIIGRVKRGEVLTIVGQNPEGTWLEVRLKDGKVGWVYKRLVKVLVQMEKVPVETEIPTPPPTFTPSATSSPAPTSTPTQTLAPPSRPKPQPEPTWTPRP